MSGNILTVSPSPHMHGNQNVPKIMWGVIYAMIPALLVSIYFFGLEALRVTLIAVAACVLFEFLIQKYLIKGMTTIGDGSAIITGILIAFNVPSDLPWWIVIIGSLVAIGMGKMSFGGLGKNPFNPALVGRVFLLISFPVQMTSWPVVNPLFSGKLVDASTGPTPLAIMKEGLANGETVTALKTQIPEYMDLLMGNMGGSLGEVSAIALFLGALFMLFRKIISWHIPVSYIASVIIFSGILWLINPEQYVDPLFHLITGGLMLGVFFMATDMVTSPMAGKGQIIFGLGCGVLTILIRVFGAYPEGVSFAILIMNAFVPLINRGFKPVRFGEKINI
ncbi:MAG: RnfABCDGE type electron transport complex subunit D [Bacteroidetes bacterium]|nr:RnfABCDGE type electron transport complex subunit D [Bacteroidota bacterium]MBL6962931.1 RnfABCDGE type electron transport complex subunit D [Bacteroidota bacterium]